MRLSFGGWRMYRPVLSRALRGCSPAANGRSRRRNVLVCSRPQARRPLIAASSHLQVSTRPFAAT